MAHKKIDPSGIVALSDGSIPSSEIAKKLGLRAKFVQATQLKYNLPRWKPGCPVGKHSANWQGGTHIDRDGYLLLSVKDHPRSRVSGQIGAHRLLMEIMIGRLLLEEEVVDHKNGLKLDNRTQNLRLFRCNGEHLRKTLHAVPKWSKDGFEKMCTPHRLRKSLPRIDSYRLEKESGAERERQIRLLRESLDTDAPALLRKVLSKLLKQGHHHPTTRLEHLL